MMAFDQLPQSRSCWLALVLLLATARAATLEPSAITTTFDETITIQLQSSSFCSEYLAFAVGDVAVSLPFQFQSVGNTINITIAPLPESSGVAYGSLVVLLVTNESLCPECSLNFQACVEQATVLRANITLSDGTPPLPIFPALRCNPGQEFTTAGCLDCDSTAFSPHGLRCFQRSACPSGTQVSNPTSPRSSDAICVECPEDTFRIATGNQSTCEPQPICPFGSEVATVATLSSSRTCQSCVAGFEFSSITNAEACQVLTPCSEGEVRIPPPTSVIEDSACDVAVPSTPTAVVTTRYGSLVLLNVSKPVSPAATMAALDVLAVDGTSLSQLQASFGLASFATIQVPAPTTATTIAASYLYTTNLTTAPPALTLSLPSPLLTLSAGISLQAGGITGMLIQASYTSSTCPASNASLSLRLIQLTDSTTVTVDNAASPCNGATKLGIDELLFGPLLLELYVDGTAVASGQATGLPIPSLSNLSWALVTMSSGALSDTTLAVTYSINTTQVTSSLPANWSLSQLVSPELCQTMTFNVVVTDTVAGDQIATLMSPLTNCNLLQVQTAVVNNLTAFTTYTVALQLLHDAEELTSHTFEVTTEPGQPETLLISDITVTPSSNALALAWVYPDSQWHGPVGSFAVQVSADDELGDVTTVAGLSLEVSDLVAFTNYTLLITPIGVCPRCRGNTTMVNTVTLAGIPSAVGNLTVVNVTATTAVVNWAAPEDYQGLPVAIEVVVVGSEASFNLTLPANATQVELVNLPAFASLNVSVIARNNRLASETASLVLQTLAGVPGSSITVGNTSFAPVLALDEDSRLLPEPFTTEVTLDWFPTSPELLDGSNIQYEVQVDDAPATLVSLPRVTFRTRANSTVQVQIAIVNEIAKGNATSVNVVVPSAAGFTAVPINATCIRVTLLEDMPQDFMVRYIRGGQASLRTVNATNSVSQALCNLEEGFNFVIWVSLLTSNGYLGFSQPEFAFTPSALPSAAPTNLTVVSFTATSATLSWVPPNETDINGIFRSYRLSRRAGTALPTPTDVTSTTATSTLLTPLLPFTRYNVTIRVQNEIGLGPLSPVLQFVTGEAAPEEPRDLTIQALSSTAIVVSWIPPRSANGIIQHYELSYSNIDNDDAQTISTLVNTTNITITNLEIFSSYRVDVAARTSGGLGPITSSSGKTLADLPTFLLSSPSVTEVTTSEARVDWSTTPFQGDLNGAQLTNYSIRLTPLESDQTELFFSANLPPVTVTGLTASTPYAVEVAVNNEIGPGPYSASTNIITLQAVPSAAPANFAVSGVSSTFLVLIWQPLPATSANGVIIRYTITATVQDEDSPSFIRTVDGTASALVLDSLDAATVYVLRISATNEAGDGPESAPLVAPRTQSSGEGTAPRDLRVSAINDVNVTLSWTEPRNNVNLIVRYLLDVFGEFRAANGSTLNFHPDSIDPVVGESRPIPVPLSAEVDNRFTIVLGSLAPSTQYVVNVQAEYEDGTVSASSTPRDFETEQGVAGPPISLGFPAQTLTARQIQLTWRPPLQSTGIVSYRVCYALQKNDTCTVLDKATAECSQVDALIFFATELVPFTSYAFLVQAFNSKGGGELALACVQTLIDAPEGPPIITNVTSTRSAMTAIASPPLEPNGPIVAYTVQYRRVDQVLATCPDQEVKLLCSVVFQATNPDNLTLQVNSLLPAVTYSFVYLASTQLTPTALTSPATASLSIKTKEAPPTGVVPSLTAVPLSTAFNLTWLPAHRPNGILTLYNLTWQRVDACDTLVPLEATQALIVPQPPELKQAVARFDAFANANENPELIAWVNGDPINFQLPGLEPFTSYVLAISSATAEGFGPFSPDRCFKTSEAPPSEPTLVEATLGENNRVTVSWEAPAVLNGELLRYQVLACRLTPAGEAETFDTNRCQDRSTVAPSIATTTLDTTAALPSSSLGVGTASTIGFGSTSPEPTTTNAEATTTTTSAAVIETTSGSPFESINSTSSGNTTTTVPTTTPEPACYLPSSACDLASAAVTASVNLRVDVTLLPAFTSIQFLVRGVNIAGPGAISPTGPVINTDPRPPNTVVGNITIADQADPDPSTNSRSITFDFVPLSREQSNGPAEYVITFDDVGRSFEFDEDDEEEPARRRRRRDVTVVDNPPVVLTSLDPATVYNISVTARTDGGLGPQSTPVSVTTTEGVPDDPPANVRAINFDNTIEVTWVPVDEPNGALLGYRVFALAAGSDTADVTEVGDVTQTNLDLDPGQEYEIRVAGYTAVGEGPLSDQARVVISRESSDNSSVLIGILVPVIVVLLVLAAIVIYRERRRSSRQVAKILAEQQVLDVVPYNFQNLRSDIRMENEGNDESDDLYGEIHREKAPREIDPRALEFKRELGSGAFGEVWAAVLDPKKLGSNSSEGPLFDDDIPRTVAIKILKKQADRREAINLLAEASLQAQFDHPNVLPLIGAVTVKSPVLVMPFCPNGSLELYIRKAEARKDWFPFFILDIVRGMNYLSSMNFVHRDIAARNVLLDTYFHCKICDFGMSRAVTNNDDYYTASQAKVPLRWTAPEAVVRRKFSEQSDIWSFGVLMWEVFACGERPYGPKSNFQVQMEVLNGYRLAQPELCDDSFYIIMRSCWEQDPHLRPSFDSLYQMLKAVVMYRELVDLRLNSHSVDSNGNVLSSSNAPSKKTITHSGDAVPLNGVQISSSAPPLATIGSEVEVVKPGKARASFPSIAVTESRGQSLKRGDSTSSQLTRHATVFVDGGSQVLESQV
eukprot:m.277930 g.277930  ORF g.277930 m.277930 type:complete len:2740 (-) comp17715_c0_seq2:2905-11124(-)